MRAFKSKKHFLFEDISGGGSRKIEPSELTMEEIRNVRFHPLSLEVPQQMHF